MSAALPLWIVLAVPAVTGVFVLAAGKKVRFWMFFSLLTHTMIVAWCWRYRSLQAGPFRMDALSLLFLSLLSLSYLVGGMFAAGTLREEQKRLRKSLKEGVLFASTQEHRFAAAVLFSLAAASAVFMTHDPRFLGLGILVHGLASTPLIVFQRHPAAMQAGFENILRSAKIGALTWVSFALMQTGLVTMGFLFGVISGFWLMGIFPFCSWWSRLSKHAAAMSLVFLSQTSFLLGLALLLRLTGSANDGVGDGILHMILEGAGLAVMAASVAAMVKDRHYFRLIAWAMAYQVGVVILAIGARADFASLLHMVNLVFVCGALWVVAGNLHERLGTRHLDRIGCDVSCTSASATLGLLSLLALFGVPPFGMFLSHFLLLRTLFMDQAYFLAVADLILNLLAFAALARVLLPLFLDLRSRPGQEAWWRVASAIALGFPSLTFGLFVPNALESLIARAHGLPIP